MAFQLPAARYLRTEYLVHPLGVDTPRPRFSWVVPPPPGNGAPSAYQLIVSSSSGLARRGRGDIWDSGRTASRLTYQIPYGGPPLQGSTRYFWRVRWWDLRNRSSPFSPTAFFETGVLDRGSWRGSWIGPAECLEFASPGTTLSGEFQGDYIQAHAVYLRKEFSLRPGWKRARAFVCGLDTYEFRLNGKKVGDLALEPAWTDYRLAALYSTYDLTRELRPGPNALGVILGNGRHIKNYGYGWPKLFLQLEVDRRDGSRFLLATGTDWKTSPGPLTENSIYGGQVHDFRLEQEGWDKPGFDDGSWRPAVAREASPLLSQMMPGVRIGRRLKARRVRRLARGVYLCDFGQNFAGWTQLAAKGGAGARVEIRHAELLDADGGLNTAPNQNAAAADIFILRGGRQEVLEPRFTYHGFRYAEVRGLPGGLNPGDITGCAVHSDVRPAGSFNCSHPLLNRIHRNVRWGLLSNLMSIPTDCPQRDERHGWLGDAHLAAEAAIFNFDMAAFYAKFLADIRRAQRPDGSLPDFVPPYFLLTYPADPAWASAYLQLAWLIYFYYGDIRVLEDHFPTMRKYADFLIRRASGHLQLRLGKYGDWCPPGSIAPKKTPVELTATWYYLHDLRLLQKISRVLGSTGDERRYGQAAESVEEAFNRKFLGPEGYAWLKFGPTDKVAGQTSQVLPLALGIVPENKKELVLGKLLESLVVHHDHHLDTGILGTRYLLEVLTDHGQAGTAFRVATQTSYPGWGYMIREGATTLWERWEKISGGGMNSHNHIMLGSVDAWFFKTLAGLQCLAPAWERLAFKPHVFPELSSASARLETIRGPLEAGWIRQDDSLHLHLALPPGSTAEVHVPRPWPGGVLREGKAILWQEDRPAGEKPGVLFTAAETEWFHLRAEGGSFHFILERNPSRPPSR